MKPRILLDMDEVLADFTGLAAGWHGWSRAWLEAARKPNQWKMEEIIGLTNEEFWKPICEGGEKFWLGVGELPWYEEILALAISYCQSDWWIVSSPESGSPYEYSGKVKWIEEHIHHRSNFNRFVFTQHKQLLAKPGVILIDDREQNAQQFIGAGGDAILFPSWANCLHAQAEDPIPYVTEQLAQIVDRL